MSVGRTSPSNPSPPHCSHGILTQFGTHWLNEGERATHVDSAGQHARDGGPPMLVPAALASPVPHGCHGRLRQEGTHCEKSSERLTHVDASGQHVSPLYPIPAHWCQLRFLQLVGGRAAFRTRRGTSNAAAPPWSFGTHCEKSSSRSTHVLSGGQHVEPTKPLPPHWEKSTLLHVGTH